MMDWIWKLVRYWVNPTYRYASKCSLAGFKDESAGMWLELAGLKLRLAGFEEESAGL